MKKSKKISIGTLFEGLQEQMLAKLGTVNVNVLHSTSKGDATELNWLEMLNTYLPKRYKADKAFVVDSKGNISEQIDIVIYDRHYSPFLFNQDETLYVPAESVYSVIEVKPTINKKYLEYAGSKAASVRRLLRTSTPIPSAGGELPAKEPFRILAGILATKSSWNPSFGKSFEKSIKNLSKDHEIDFGCVLNSGSFRISSKFPAEFKIEKSKASQSLIFFFLELLKMLKMLATVPSIDLDEYEKTLKKK